MSAAPTYSAPPASGQGPQFAPQPKNGLGIAALILGIAGIVLGFIPFVGFGLAALLGVIGLVLGIFGILRVKKNVANNKVLSIIGTILSAIAIIVSIIGLITLIAFLGSVNQAIQDSSNDPVASQPSAGADAPAADGTADAAAARFPGQLEKDVVGDAGAELAVGDATITSSPLTPTTDDAVGDLYCTDVSITNNGTETLTGVSTFSFTVQNPAGAATDATFTTVDGELPSSDIAPGGTSAGKVCFSADQVSPGENVVLYEELISFDDVRGAWVNTIA